METTENYKGYIIKIINDDHSESPRNWDNLGTMACFHGRYSLGDTDHGLTLEQAQSIENNDKEYISLPIYMYDHSGITIRTYPFSCRFDSGQLGIIFVSLEQVRKEYNITRVTKKLREKIESYLTNEIDTYDQFLCGNVYGYEITDALGIEIESCWGYYGDNCIVSARAIVDSLVAREAA